MIEFDTATSFLTLLINKSYRKKLEVKLKGFQLHNKKIKTIFASKVLSSNPSPRFEKFCWPVMVVKLRKGQKILKKFEKVENFNKILLKLADINILRTISLSQEITRIPVSSLK